MKGLLTTILLIANILVFGQTTIVNRYSTLIKSNHNFGLVNPVYNQGSDLSYDADTNIINEKGAAFSIHYINQDGGNDFDGYPSGTVGAFSQGNNYYMGNYATSGMPVQLKNLKNDLRIKWKTFQYNAHDSDDKWWASINVVFDGTDSNLAPVETNRLYDLVIEFESSAPDPFVDKPYNSNGAYYWFARRSNGTIIPFILNIDGVEYKWAMRYKFFNYPVGHPKYYKNQKVHAKFIPYSNTVLPPELDHPLKIFVDATRIYIDSVPTLPAQEKALAKLRVAKPNLWVKRLAAGYEIYKGNSTLGQDYFYTIIDTISPDAPSNLTAIQQNTKVHLNWDYDTTENYESFKIYRSINGQSFDLIDSMVYTNHYEDSNITIGSNYKYYVREIDRSFNESTASNNVSLSITSIDEKMPEKLQFYPNPSSDYLYFSSNVDLKDVEIYNMLGQQQPIVIDGNRIDIKALSIGVYFILINNNTYKFIRN